uniref:Uncharacterized protein n=1 Tax=Arion vulgaris TaxID=1028688 RepID=A0A0B6YRZ9_9EUPU
MMDIMYHLLYQNNIKHININSSIIISSTIVTSSPFSFATSATLLYHLLHSALLH